MTQALNRRALVASLILAPAVVRAESLMRIVVPVEDWLECDGSLHPISRYPALAERIIATGRKVIEPHRRGNAEPYLFDPLTATPRGHFRVPDLRGIYQGYRYKMSTRDRGPGSVLAPNEHAGFATVRAGERPPGMVRSYMAYLRENPTEAEISYHRAVGAGWREPVG